MLYVLTFEVASTTDDQLEQIDAQFDTIAAEGHGAPQITALVDADDAPEAFQIARRAMGEAGVRVLRYLPDLVTRSEIARRAVLTTQAVGNYVRGQRGAAFPVPYLNVPDPVWLWSEVLDWLRAHGREVEDAGNYPSRIEAEAFMHRVWDEAKVNGGWTKSGTIRTDAIQRSSASSRHGWSGPTYTERMAEGATKAWALA